MKRIRVSNKLYMEGLSPPVTDAIIDALSIPNPAYEDAYTRTSWTLRKRGVAETSQQSIIKRMLAGIDPMMCLATRNGDTLEAPRGCFPAIKPLFREDEISWEGPGAPRINIASNAVLRDYQERFVSGLQGYKFPSSANGPIPGSGVGVAPPGAGKTVMGAELISRLGYKTLWITHTSALAGQTKERFEAFLDKPHIEVIGGGKWKIGDITIALVQTLFRRDLSDLRDAFGLVVVDECHHVPARTFSEVVGSFNPVHLFGLSATPYRKDGLQALMFQSLGPQIVQIEKQELINSGHLVPATIVQVPTPCFIPDNLSEYRDVIDTLHNSSARTSKIVAQVAEDAKAGHECIVLVDEIAYGEAITRAVCSRGLSCELVFSTKVASRGRGKKKVVASMSAKERSAVLSRFRARDTKVLVATYDLLSEGFDHAPLDRLFMTIPISDKNKALLEQTIGRVERPSPGKKEAIVYDYVDNHRMLLRQAEGRLAVYEDNHMNVSK